MNLGKGFKRGRHANLVNIYGATVSPGRRHAFVEPKYQQWARKSYIGRDPSQWLIGDYAKKNRRNVATDDLLDDSKDILTSLKGFKPSKLK